MLYMGSWTRKAGKKSMGTDECIVTILYIVRKSLILQKSALLCPNIVFNLQSPVFRLAIIFRSWV